MFNREPENFSVRRLLAGAALLLVVGGPSAAQEVVLDPVIIQGQPGNANQASADGDDDSDYVAKQTTTGSKIETPLREIPQSVSVVTRKELDDRRPAQLEDAIAYTSGIVASPWGTDDRYDQCLIRGFDLCTYALFRDGLTQKTFGWAGFKIEPYGMERFEVLKGPAGVLYGESDVGGIINVVTKRPTLEPLHEGYVSYGSFNTVEAGIDVGGPLDEAGVWSYRLTGLFRDGETEQDYSRNDRVYIAPALTWQPDAQTSLTLLANYQWDDLTPLYEVPVPGMNGYTGPAVSRSFFAGSPDFDKFDANHGSIGYQFSHEFDERWSVRQNVRLARQETDYNHLYVGDANGGPSVLPDGHTVARTAFTVDSVATVFNIDNQVQYDATLGIAENTLLAGFDYNRWNADTQEGYGEGPSLDILNPDYGAPIAAPPIYYDGEDTVDQFGLYVQNHTKLADRVVVALGGRQAWVENSSYDRLESSSSTQKDQAFIGQAGVAYLFDNGVTPYASYAETFVVNLGHTKDGESFVPSEGKQYEVGVKYDPTFMPGTFTAALFDLRKTNIQTTDPDDPNFSIQTGEVRHRGLELEAKTELDFGLSLIGSYTYLDAEITESNDGYVGKRPSLVPEHTASLWANYEFGENAALKGLSLGAGVRYVGSSFGDDDNTLLVPSYTVADAALRYKRGSWEAALNVSNVFDKKYFSTCYPGAGCYYGEGRNIKGSLNVKF